MSPTDRERIYQAALQQLQSERYDAKSVQTLDLTSWGNVASLDVVLEDICQGLTRSAVLGEPKW